MLEAILKKAMTGIAGIALCSSLYGCERHIVRQNSYPITTPIATKVDNLVAELVIGDRIKDLQKPLKDQCDYIWVDETKMECIDYRKECVSWSDFLPTPYCEDVRHPATKGNKWADPTEAYTTRECGVREERHCLQDEKKKKTVWTLPKEGCRDVRVDAKEYSDGSESFSVIAAYSSTPEVVIEQGTSDKAAAFQIANMISAYCRSYSL